MADLSPTLPDRYLPWPSASGALLGRGGASEVWRVKDRHLGVLVALKVLRREGARFQARLEREAALNARIHHPKVVAVHDVGMTPEGHSYVAFALASEGSLLDQGSRPLPWSELKAFTCDLLEALGACHARGILHLDVKLGNLLIHRPTADSRRVLWLADLGVSRARFDDDDKSVVGTVSYMPGERLTGQHHLWQPSSDLFSVGAVLYRMLVGKLPFPARDPADGLAERQDPPTSMKIKASWRVPPGLDDIVLAMLQPDPRSRFDLAADALRAIQALPELSPMGVPEPARPANPAGRAQDTSDPRVPLWFRPAPERMPLPPLSPVDDRPVPLSPNLLMHREIPLVGRDAELAALWQAAEFVRDEQIAHVVHLTGSRGTGRTRLMEEFTRAAEEAGLGEGVLFQYAVRQGPTFGLRGALRRIAPPPMSDKDKDHRRYPKQVARTLARDRRATVETVADDARTLAAWINPRGGDAPTTDRSVPRAALMEHLAHRCWRGICWLWLEDLHLADDNDDAWPLMDQLLGLDIPVMIVVTTDSDELSPSLLELEARQPERFTTLELSPLPRDSASQLASTFLRLHPDLTDQLVHTTGGSPQYMRSLLLHWNRVGMLEHSRVPGSDEPVWALAAQAPPLPASRSAFARELIESTLETQPELQEPLLALALAGRGTPEEVLVHVMGEHLDTLIVQGLVSLEAGMPVFSPRELERELPTWVQDPVLERQLHARLAAAWAEQGSDPDVLARVGRHRAAAGDLAGAIGPLDRALSTLRHTLPVPELVRLGRLAQHAAEGTGRIGSTPWARNLRILSEALGRGGRLEEALSLDEQLARASLDAVEAVLCACLHAEHLDVVQGPEAALVRLEAVEELTEEVPGRLRAAYLCARASCQVSALRLADAHADVQAALALRPSPNVECKARQLRAKLMFWSDPSVAWYEALRTIEVSRDHGLLGHEVRAWGQAAEKMVTLGDLDGALARVDAGVARLRNHGDRLAAARTLLQKGDLLRTAGLPAEALSAWAEGLAELGTNVASVRSSGRIAQCALALAQGDPAGARKAVVALSQQTRPAAQVAVAFAQPWLALQVGVTPQLPLPAQVAEVAQLGLEGMILARSLSAALRKRKLVREAQRIDQVLSLSCRVLGTPSDLAAPYLASSA